MPKTSTISDMSSTPKCRQHQAAARLWPLIGAVALAAFSIGAASTTAAENRPDVLFILIDDLRFDALSCAGHPFVETPNIDRLRDSGAWFENAFVTTSICCPSRATFLTGCYASRHGVIDNETAEYNEATTPPLTKYLQAAGYSTAMIGKWHMGFSGRPRPTFDHWISFDGQGVYNNPKLNINGKPTQRQGYITDILTQYAVDYIQQQPTDRPYFLMLSHKAVHEPFQPAERHADSLGPDRSTPEPVSWRDDFRGKPLWQRRERTSDVRWHYRTRDREQEQIPDSVPAEPWKPEQRYVDQLRCILAVDDGVGRVMEALRKRGTLDKTLIVFASDNGYFHLEHRRWDKRLAYDESMRIPMIVAYPEVVGEGSTVSQLVTNADFSPTILDYAGLPTPSQMQGGSMRPLFEDANADWRDHVYYEYWTELVHSIPTMIAVRTKKTKLVHYPTLADLDELYDLEDDPHELKNLVSANEYGKRYTMMKGLLDQAVQDAGWKPRVFPLNLPRVRGQSGTLLEIEVENGGLVDRISSQRLAPAAEVRADDEVLVLRSTSPPIELPYSKQCEPSSWPYDIEVSFKAETDGVLFSQSGPASGLAFFVEDSRPVVTARVKTWTTTTTTIDGPKLTPGDWTDVRITVDFNRLAMSVNGKLVEEVALPLPLKKPTKSPMIIGGPSQIQASQECPSTPLSGLVRRLRIRRPAPVEETGPNDLP
jgi:N-acetylglucosamine-6-sulfatase